MNNEEIYRDLKQKLIQEKLAPGEWLVEREISDQYGISRTPVREVLRKLVTDGFLELKPARGYVVRKLTLKEIVEIFQARESIEGMLTRLACQRGDESFFARISELRQQLEQLEIEKQSALGVKIGKKLHDSIAQAANNALLLEFYRKLTDLAAMTRNITKKSVNIESHSKEAHLALMQAIEARDPEHSEHLMRQHLHNTCRELLETYVIIQGDFR